MSDFKPWLCVQSIFLQCGCQSWWRSLWGWILQWGCIWRWTCQTGGMCYGPDEWNETSQTSVKPHILVHIITLTSLVRYCLLLLPFLTACMSRVSTLRSKAVRFMVSNTSLRVWPRPRSMCTISPGYFFMALLMNRSRCFWFMQDDACMCVSTWSKDGQNMREFSNACRQHFRMSCLNIHIMRRLLPFVCCRSLCAGLSSELPTPSSHSGGCASGI